MRAPKPGLSVQNVDDRVSKMRRILLEAILSPKGNAPPLAPL